MPDEQTPVATDNVATETITKICDWCGQEFTLRKRVKTRRFCNDRCRNRFHTAERNRWMDEARAANATLMDRLEKLGKRGRR
jgi:endogenous inhibitor of DNA gyrase (YacG/DUF329 family)